ncbi:MAG: hypothetical protein DME19_00165 [Verrucomicrobia bacterium]|nr:MAG: hypothetical protein DME19_00165 [Verrucomicrobiota bacterium]
MKPIKVSELIEGLELDSEERVTRVDLQNSCVVSVDRSLLSAFEEGDEDVARNLPDWQKEEAEIARAMVEDSGDRFVRAPDKFEFHEYRHMERFIGTVEDAEAVEQLWRAIKGKGAFRYFKDTASRLGLLEDWYRYRADAMKEFVMDWAEANNIRCEDDVKGRKGRARRNEP